MTTPGNEFLDQTRQGVFLCAIGGRAARCSGRSRRSSNAELLAPARVRVLNGVLGTKNYTGATMNNSYFGVQPKREWAFTP